MNNKNVRNLLIYHHCENKTQSTQVITSYRSNQGTEKVLQEEEFVYLFLTYATHQCQDRPGREARSFANMPLSQVLVLIALYFRQFLTRLVQNLTLRNDCNLIPFAHRTQQGFCPLKTIIGQLGGSLHRVYLSKGPLQRREVRVDNPQLSL